MKLINHSNVIEWLEILRMFRKTIQMLACTFALIILSFLDAAMSEFTPNELAYYTLAGMAGFTVWQSVKEKVDLNKSEKHDE